MSVEHPLPGPVGRPARTADDTYGYERLLDAATAPGPEDGAGLTNHLPMVLEALSWLGYVDRFPRFVDQGAPSTDPLDRAAARHSPTNRVLGDMATYPAWLTQAEAELADTPWESVLRDWLPVLAPGLAAGAGHGLLRTMHAVRALTVEDSPGRRRELARGLAYWAARYQRPPGRHAAHGTRQLTDAVAALPVRTPLGNELIRDALQVLEDDELFQTVVDGVAVTELEPRRLLEAFAPLAGGGIDPIVYTHVLTVPAALLVLRPWCSADAWFELTSGAWRFSAGLCVLYPRADAFQDARDAGAVRSAWDLAAMNALVDAAVTTADAHAVKVVAAVMAAIVDDQDVTANPLLDAAAHIVRALT